MSLYAYYGNNNTIHGDKLRLFICNECGSFDLRSPRNSESDHRDVLRFTCNKCGNNPYWSWMDTYDVIKVNKLNKDNIFMEICKTYGRDPKDHEWQQDVLDIMDDE